MFHKNNKEYLQGTLFLKSSSILMFNIKICELKSNLLISSVAKLAILTQMTFYLHIP